VHCQETEEKVERTVKKEKENGEDALLEDK
jgi:hypothetical protein